MISRHEKTFKVDRHGRVDVVSIDRLKPAHVDDSVLPNLSGSNANPTPPPSEIPRSSSDPTLENTETQLSHPDQQATQPMISDERGRNETIVSRSGRKVSLPVRFRD